MVVDIRDDICDKNFLIGYRSKKGKLIRTSNITNYKKKT